jgi:Cu+-exporting ATPase
LRHELVNTLGRLSLALTVPVLELAIAEMRAPGLAERVSPPARLWAQPVFSAQLVLWGGWPFFVRGWQSIVTSNLNTG